MTIKKYSMEEDDFMEFRQTGYDQDKGVGKWIKYLFGIFLFANLIGAFAVLGIGLWAYEAEYGSKILSKLIGVNLYQVDSYIMIGGGSAIIFIVGLGVCGFVAQYRCLMGLHLSLLAFMSVMLFVAGILGYVLISDLEDKVRNKMSDTLVNNYGINVESDMKNKEITDAWDEIQKNFKCCGVYGAIDSMDSWAIYKTKSHWFSKQHSNNTYVPDSCCDKENSDLCVYLHNSTFTSPDPILSYPESANFTLYTEGCFDKLDPLLERTGIVIGTTAIVIGVLLLVELVLSVMVYRMLPR